MLVDVAHLKVSCKTLGLDFASELKFLMAKTDYIHLSDNNGLSDRNRPIFQNSKMCGELKKHLKKINTYTIEVYGEIQEINKTYSLINELL